MLWALIGSRSLMAALGLFSAAAAYEAWKVHQQHLGETEIVQAAKEAGEKANVESEAARAAADKPGALDRLRRSACRDCQGEQGQRKQPMP